MAVMVNKMKRKNYFKIIIPLYFFLILILVFLTVMREANATMFSNMKGKIIYSADSMMMFDPPSGKKILLINTDEVKFPKFENERKVYLNPYFYLKNINKIVATVSSYSHENKRTEKLILFTPQENSFEILMDLTEYATFSYIATNDESHIIVSGVPHGENTFKRGQPSNHRGRRNYNKTLLFVVNLKNDKKVIKLNIPHIEHVDMAISPDNKKLAFNYVEFVVEGDKTYDEVVKTGVEIRDLTNLESKKFIEGISHYNWSPDSRMESFVKGSEMIIRSISDQTIIRKIKFHGDFGTYAWSPDSQYIVYQYFHGFNDILSQTRILEIHSGKSKSILRAWDFTTRATGKPHFLQWIP